MILQALTKYYETLLEQGRLSPPGWDDGFKVSFGLELDEAGNLLQVLPFKDTVQKGKKQVEVPRIMKVPFHVKRAVNIAPNFLCDNAAYLLGIDSKGKPERALHCFEAARELHLQVLEGVDTPAAKAVLNFFANWQPTLAAEHPEIVPFLKEFSSGANLIFCYDLQPVTEDAQICTAWQQHYSSESDAAQQGQCLVTGKAADIATLHPAIKGVWGAQSMGASLVSFNAPAFESYGHEQGSNAPVSRYAAFAYATALNTLLADSDHCRAIGDTTVVCWAEHGSTAYQDFAMDCMLGGERTGISDAQLASALKSISRGICFDWGEITLDPDEHFYILGLSPNAARLSVRFFFQDSFGSFAQNIDRFYEDMEIVRPGFDPFERLPLWRLLGETVNQNSRNKEPAPQLAGDMLRAVLFGTPYPATLLNGTQLRIQAEREVTRGRAAILKGYYLRHPNEHCPKEVLQMELNPNATHIPYVLGRLFCVLEQIQTAALPGLNSTIKDRYFTSAAATPATIFPQLVDRAQSHLKVLRREKKGLAITLERQISDLMALTGENFPTRLTLPERGSFQLGYYFELQARYQKKNDKEEINNG